MAAKGASGQIDLAVAALAQRQHGVVALIQLHRLGLTRNAVATRVAAGRLHRLHRGVYAVGHRLIGAKGHWLAAVFAVRNGAVLSHRAAAALWDLLPVGSLDPEVVVARHVRPRPHITVRCVGSLPTEDTTAVDRIPCTSVTRTLFDLAAVVPPRRLERALGQAEVLKLYDRTALEAILAAHPGRPGSPKLRRLIGRADLATSLTRSPLEERFLQLCDRAGLPRPECNAPFTLPDGTEILIDAFWRDAGLAVELDGHRYHSTPSARARDGRRDAQLTLARLRPIRLGEVDLTSDARGTVQLLRGLLAPA